MLGRANIDEIYDKIRVMRRQEDGPYQCGDYLAHYASGQQAQHHEIFSGLKHQQYKAADAECRSKMASWFYQVAESCNFNREVVELSVRCLDRFLDTLKSAPELHVDALNSYRMYQLASMTALYITVKTTEEKILDPRIVSKLSRGFFSEEDIKRTEVMMLGALQWRVNPPTATSFLRHLLLLLPACKTVDIKTRKQIDDKATHQVEKSILDYGFVTTRPSVIAYAALLNSTQGVDGRSLPSSERAAFLKDMAFTVGLDDMSLNEIAEVRERLLVLLSESSCVKFKTDSETICQKSAKKQSYCHSEPTDSPRCVLHKKKALGHGKATN